MLRLGKQRGRVVAVADIGGGSAGVSVVDTASTPSRLLIAERVSLSAEGRTSEASISGVMSKLEEAAQKALKAYSERPDKPSAHVDSAYAIVRAPWVRSKTVRVESPLEAETKIEHGTVANLAKQALEKDTELDHTKILEASVVRVELNGYPTANPEGKVAHHVAAAVFLSECDPEIKNTASETLTRIFACPPPTFRTGTRALLAALKENEFLKKYCLIINMTSEATDLVTIRKEIATDIVHISEGARSIVERVAGGKMPEETLGMIRMIAQEACETEACKAVEEAMVRAEPELVRTFGETMAKMAAARRLPDDLILLAPHDLADWLLEFFSRIDFAQFTITTRPFSPRIESAKDFKKSFELAHGANPDPSLSVASALVSSEIAT